jgi:Ca-activated chloride channel homolog
VNRALVSALAAPLLAATVFARQAVFKASVDLVSVDVLATANGKPLAGLTAADFEILDNKVPQKIDSISGEGTVGTIALRRIPLDIVLVFDVSESMAGDKLEQLVDASRNVLAKLGPGDRAALVTFSQRTMIRQPLSSDVAAVVRAVDRLDASGQTSMFDALYAGLSLRRTSDTRSMMLLFSDGRDNTSWLSGKQVAQAARESDVVVYAVGLDTRVKDDLKEITEETGGAVLVAQSAKDLKTLFERIVREMQARYVLNYYPNGVAQSGWHTIEVRLPGRRAEVVARRGYWRR